MIEIWAISCITAYTWAFFLTDEGMIFDFIPKLLDRYNAPEKLHNVLYWCSKCVGGQIAFWWGFTLPIKQHIICVNLVIFTLGVIEQTKTFINDRL